MQCVYIGYWSTVLFQHIYLFKKDNRALKVMPVILLCWPTLSQVDVCSMTVEVEPLHQYSITFCCCATNGSRGAVWQNAIWHGMCMKQKCGVDFLHAEKITYWPSLMLAECWWRPTVDVSTVRWWVVHFSSGVATATITFTGADFYERGMKALAHPVWKCICNSDIYVEK